jgi:flagellar biosynthesis protein FliR
MTPTISAAAAWAPIFAIVLARIAAILMFLPALGEQVIPSQIKIGLALSLTVLLLPELRSLVQPEIASSTNFALTMVGEVVIGAWFGWLVRLAMLALPMFGQISSYLIGLSSVLQPDIELGPQTTSLSKILEVLAPLLVLAGGLYKPPLMALDRLFRLYPPGHSFPAGDGVQLVIDTVGQSFQLALQLASPFILGAVVWHIAVGLLGRMVARIQLYFASAAGQIIGGFLIFIVTAGGIFNAWHDGAMLLITRLSDYP